MKLIDDTMPEKIGAHDAGGIDADLPAEAPGVQKVRVLIVDDCQEHLQALSMAIGDLGFEVRVACNGELALTQMSEFRPHCVVTDVNMPVMNGYELAQSLKTYLDVRPVLIGMSAAAPIGMPTHGISSLVDAWFDKPIDLGELERGLKRLLRPDVSSAG